MEGLGEFGTRDTESLKLHSTAVTMYIVLLLPKDAKHRCHDRQPSQLYSIYFVHGNSTIDASPPAATNASPRIPSPVRASCCMHSEPNADRLHDAIFNISHALDCSGTNNSSSSSRLGIPKQKWRFLSSTSSMQAHTRNINILRESH